MFIKRKSSNLFKKSATLALNKVKKPVEAKVVVEEEVKPAPKRGKKVNIGEATAEGITQEQ